MDIGPTIIHTTKSAAKTARAPVNPRQALQPKPAAKPSLPSHSSCMQPSSSAKPGHTNLSLMQSGLMQPVQQRQQQMLQHASMNQWDMMNLDFSLQGLPSQHHGCAKHGSVDWAITAQIGSDVPDSQPDAISPGASRSKPLRGEATTCHRQVHFQRRRLKGKVISTTRTNATIFHHVRSQWSRVEVATGMICQVYRRQI